MKAFNVNFESSAYSVVSQPTQFNHGDTVEIITYTASHQWHTQKVVHNIISELYINRSYGAEFEKEE